MKFGALWVGSPLYKLQQTCLSSFIYYGHDLVLYVYDQSIEVPKGVIKKDANEIMLESDIFLIENSYAAFSDLFRYRMIKQTGRAWVDTDIICMSSDWNFKNNTFASIEHTVLGSFVTGGVLGLPQDSDIVDYLIHESTNFDKTKIVWNEVGPALVDKAFKKFNYQEYIYPQEIFCGISLYDFENLWNPNKLQDILSLESVSKSISAYNQMTTRAGKDKNSFPTGSALDYFYHKFILNSSVL
jgi:hypothetical protein